MSAIKKMLDFTKGRHWYKMYLREDIGVNYSHISRYHRKPLRKRSYGLRKNNFVKYTSHRKRGVDYMPF